MDNTANEIMPTADKVRIDDQLDIFFGFYGSCIPDENKDTIRDYLKVLCGLAWGMGNASGTNATLKIMSR